MAKKSPPPVLTPIRDVPERNASDFNSTGDTGIVVDYEVQLGQDPKSQQLMQAFIQKYLQKKQEEPAK